MGLFTLLRRRLVPDFDARLAPTFYDTFAANPVVTYDVGAAGSLYTPYPEGVTAWAPVIGFEPHTESYKVVVDKGLPANGAIYQMALADRDGPVTFHSGLDEARTVSSLLPIDVLGVAHEVQTVEAMRLDSVPEILSIPNPNFIKLDTEGSEDVILAHGESVLAHDVLGLLVEVSFWRPNAGSTFATIDQFLTKRGFILFDLQINRSDIRFVGGRKDKVRSGDALYLRNFETLPQAADDAGFLRTALLKLISLAVAWRYLNYALELADYGFRHQLLTNQEFMDITQPIVSTVDLSDRIPNFPGREALARLFDVLSYALHPKMKKGVPHAFNGLGNHWVVRRFGKPPTHVTLHCPVLESGTLNRSKEIDLVDPHKPIAAEKNRGAGL